MARIEQTDWLESFIAVVDHGGFSAAAEAVHRSQSRVSAHIAALEQALGTVLFDRRHRPIGLTDTGAAYLPLARRAVASLDAGIAEIEAVLGVTRGRVALGSYPSASAAFLPDVLRSFHDAFPGVRVELTELPTAGLADLIGAGRLDLALRPLAPARSAEELRLTFHPLWRESLVAVLPHDHELADAVGPLPLARLAAYPLITIGGRRDSAHETHIALRDASLQPRIAWQTDQPQTLVNFVRAGLGVGFTNTLAMQIADTAGLVIRETTGSAHGRTVGVVHDADRHLSNAARALLSHIKQIAPPSSTSPPLQEHVLP